ncbi:MAG: hypothetical protein QNJ97_05870 [Myxococcota bacterium]|nr:hypothetical protein [Myxococcota bacterium]
MKSFIQTKILIIAATLLALSLSGCAMHARSGNPSKTTSTEQNRPKRKAKPVNKVEKTKPETEPEEVEPVDTDTMPPPPPPTY